MPQDDLGIDSAAAEVEIPGARPHSTNFPQRSIKVLLVEDSVVLAERLTEAIERLPHFDVIGVVDSETLALQTIKRRRVDIVLLDLHLKQGTGFGVLRALAGMAGSPTSRSPMVVILTNHDLPEYHTAAIELGATEFLDKARAFHRLPEILDETLHSLCVN